MMKPLVCLGLLLTVPAWADDEAALALADATPQAVAPRRDWQAWLEAGTGLNGLRQPNGTRAFGRLALDLSIDYEVAPGWRLAAASRLDLRREEGGPLPGGQPSSVNTLKELYLSYRVSPSRLLDGGRINLRQGVAMGFNPTDFLRAHVVRALVSIDPEIVRQNRLGTVMLRGQQLWDGGSVTALVAPRLGQGRSDAAASPDWGASNGAARALLSVSQRLNEDWTPELLLFAEQGRSPQLGLNQSLLFNGATVLNVEWSGGRGPTLLDEARGDRQAHAFHSRLAAGGSWTSAASDTLTVEYHHNGAAPDGDDLQRLWQMPALAHAWRLTALDRQDTPTRHALFLHYRRPDLLWAGLELGAMMRLDLQDDSTLHWIQLRYLQPRWEVAAQLQWRRGGPDSVWGGSGQRAAGELSVRWFL